MPGRNSSTRRDVSRSSCSSLTSWRILEGRQSGGSASLVPPSPAPLRCISLVRCIQSIESQQRGLGAVVITLASEQVGMGRPGLDGAGARPIGVACQFEPALPLRRRRVTEGKSQRAEGCRGSFRAPARSGRWRPRLLRARPDQLDDEGCRTSIAARWGERSFSSALLNSGRRPASEQHNSTYRIDGPHDADALSLDWMLFFDVFVISSRFFGWHCT
jgi:hypothetical protein